MTANEHKEYPSILNPEIMLNAHDYLTELFCVRRIRRRGKAIQDRSDFKTVHKKTYNITYYTVELLLFEYSAELLIRVLNMPEFIHVYSAAYPGFDDILDKHAVDATPVEPANN